jgi:hypothetical protein
MWKITIAKLLGGIQLAEEFNLYFGDILSLENTVDVSCEGQTATFSNLLEYLQMDKKMLEKLVCIVSTNPLQGECSR